MASLSNINGIFDVHSTGAIQFNGNHGASGQILKSNGNAAPTWIPQSDIVGAYLPLAGGTLTGATATASGISFTVGGALTAGSLAGPGSAITALNASNLASGTVALARMNKVLPTSGNYVWSASSLASTYNVGIQTAFVAAAQGWPNYGAVLHVGARGGSDAGGDYQIYCGHGSAYGGNHLRFRNADNDATPSDSWTGWKTIWDSVNLPNPVQSSGVTSVATSNGITGGTITTTGTVSLTGTYTGRWNATSGYYIDDTRAGVRTPGSWNDHSMDMFFTNQIPGNSNWLSGIQMGGWSTSSYASWQLIGPSTTTAYDTWYLRSGIGSSWNTPRQIWHTGNLPNPVQGGPYLPLAGGTMTGSINLNSNNITNAGDVYTNSWFRNNNSSEGLYNQSTGNHWYSQGSYWDTGLNGTQGIRLRNGHNGAIMGYLYSETTGQFGLLDKNGSWTYRTDGATVTELRCNNTVGFQMDASGYLTFPVNLNLGTAAPTKVFMSNNTQVKTCDLATARAQFNLAYSTFRRYDYTTDTDYSTNVVGWGAMNLNSTIPGYGSGFWDQWGTAGANGQPSTETSHWQGSQAFHYVRRSDLGNIYGYQTAVGAGDPAKMYVRGIWSGSGWGSWYRMHNDKTALIKINDQVSISTFNDRNLKIQGVSSSDAGITGYAGNGTHVWQLYGSGTSYGFLNENWAAWDLRKVKNGNLYLNNQSTYYLNPSSTSNINALTLIGTLSGQNGYFLQDLAVGFNSGAIGGKLNIQINSANGIGIKNNLNGVSNPTGLLSYTSASMNAGGYHMVFQAAPTSGSDTNMLLCNLNGNLRNRNNSYGQYSDETIKENITDATPKLEDVKKLKVKNFNFIGDDLKQIGLIAQETELVFPGLVEDDLNPQGDKIKSLKYSVLVPILVKAIQELEARVKELENK